ncbi:hypothetical protein ZWY2020_033125 [Hordeum vulgare]|nr:hypothetical protein ZWY2020_033125 [Hordeum vulgare]
MGKKKSGGGGVEKVVEVAARPREFALKVAMHCRCHAVDQSAAKATGEVRVMATSDSERLRKGLRKATDKKVDLAVLVDLQLHHQYGGQTGVTPWAASQQQLLGLGGDGGARGYGAAYPW